MSFSDLISAGADSAQKLPALRFGRNEYRGTRLMAATAAWAFVAITAGLTLFQLALAAGAPWGRFAFGGAHRRLPLGYRFGSVISILIYVLCAAIILDRAGYVDLFAGEVSKIGAWVIVALLIPGIVMNAISRSTPERLTMTPVALALAACAIVVATS